MKKQLIIGLSLCGALLVGGKTASAVEYPVSDSTVGIVGFEASDTPAVTPDPDPDPKPDDPEKPDPDPDPKPIGGALRFTHIPSIDFGSNNSLVSRTQNYYGLYEPRKAEDGTVTRDYPTHFTVEDVRGGTQGWSVNVSGNGVFKEKAGEKSFKATISVSNPNTKSNMELAADKFGPSLTTNEFVAITTDASSKVRLATADGKKEQGYGKWSVGYGSTSTITSGKGVDGTGTEGTVDATKEGRNGAVKLTVPNGQIINTKSLYETTLTWELADTI